MPSFPVSNGLKPQTPHWDLTPSEKGSLSRLRWGVTPVVGGHTRGLNFLCHAHCRSSFSIKPFPKHGSVNRLSQGCAGCFAGDRSDTLEKTGGGESKNKQTNKPTNNFCATKAREAEEDVDRTCCVLLAV